MGRFVSLHNHTTYSRQDGWGLPEQVIGRAKELGHSAIAVTDHGNICAHVPMWQEGKKQGVKVLFGCEFYVVHDLTERVKGAADLGVDETPHVTVLALTQTGYRNLLHLSRISWQDGFYFRPRIDWETLVRHQAGLAVLTGCVGGYPSRILDTQGPEECHRFLDQWRQRIANLYVEVNPCPGYDVSERTLLPLVQIARSLSLPLVVTSDSHFPCAKDYRCQDILFAFGTGRRVDDPTRTHRIPSWAYQCTDAELYRRVRDTCPALIEDPILREMVKAGLRRTQDIADAAEVDLPRAEPLRFAGLSLDEKAVDKLWQEAVTGLQRRFQCDPTLFRTYYSEWLSVRTGVGNSLDTGTRTDTCMFGSKESNGMPTGLSMNIWLDPFPKDWNPTTPVDIPSVSILPTWNPLPIRSTVKEETSAGITATKRIVLTDTHSSGTTYTSSQMENEGVEPAPATKAESGIAKFTVYLDRMAYELDVLAQKAGCDYMLVVLDIIRHVKGLGAVVLTRGSAGGCCVLWSAGGSVTDPILHDLSFDRFLDVTRDDFPDIDCDFPPRFRQAALDYVTQTYGAANVAQLANFSKFSTKSAVKAVASALGIPLGELAPLSAALSGEDDDVTGQLASIAEPRARAVLTKYPELALADQFVGQMNSYSIHACGVIIAPTPLDEVIGVMRGKDGQTVSSIDKRGAKALGHLKMDLLSVKALDIAARCLELIGQTPDWLETLPLDDPKALDCAHKLLLAGVFQLDGSAAWRVARQIGLDDLRDLDVAIAICRPGPAEYAPVYGRHKRSACALAEALEKCHPVAADIVRPTYGLLAYQEQVMKLAELVAHQPMSEVQLLRKGISDKLGTQADKEKADAWVAEWRGKFTAGCLAHGVDPKEADFWWGQIETHGGYSFNKAHSRTYALLAYWMLYLKAHYTNEFYTAYLEIECDGATRKRLIREFAALGGDVRVLDPCYSRAGTYSPQPGLVVGGYADLYGIGAAAAAKLLAKGPFADWTECLAAMTPTLRARIEASGLPTGNVDPQALVALAPWYPVSEMPDKVITFRAKKGLPLISDLPVGRTVEQAGYDEEWFNHYGPVFETDGETVIIGFVTHRNVSPKSVELLIEDETGVCPIRVSSRRLRDLGPLFRELQLGDLVAVSGFWSGDTLYVKGKKVIDPRPVITAKANVKKKHNRERNSAAEPR